MKQFSDFIFVKDDTLSSEFCEHVIQKFEDEGQSEPGGTGRFNTFNPTVKQSYDLFISPDNGWGDEDSVFFESLTACYEEYHKNVLLLFQEFQDMRSCGTEGIKFRELFQVDFIIGTMILA